MIQKDEQPYPLPDGWQWVYQKDIYEFALGQKLSGEKLPCLDVKYLRGVKKNFLLTEETL